MRTATLITTISKVPGENSPFAPCVILAQAGRTTTK